MLIDHATYCVIRGGAHRMICQKYHKIQFITIMWSGYLQKQPCHLHDETGVQFLCAASYDIMMHLTLTKRASRTNVRPHKPKWKDVCSTSHAKIERPTSGSGRWQKSYNIYDQQCEKNVMVLTACCCWLELRLRWAHQTQKQHRPIADRFNKQSVPRFSCNDIHTGESTFAVS